MATEKGKIISKMGKSKRISKTTFDDGILLEHNQRAYVDLMEAIKLDGKACAIRATGTGKMFLALKWLKDNMGEPFVYIAPTNVILNRFVETIIETFLADQAEELKTKPLDDVVDYINKNLGFNLQLFTYSKINRMDVEDIRNLKVKRVVIDEFHRCGATKWGESVNVFLELHPGIEIMGLTATPIRPSDGKNMVEEMFNGKVASELYLPEALEQGILPIPTMINAIYSFEDEIVSLEDKIRDKDLDPKKRKEMQEKLKEAKTLIGKAGGIKEIFKPLVQQILKDKGKLDVKLVVFCKDIEDRDKKMHECKSWFPGMKIKKYSLTSKESRKSIESDDESYKFTEKVIRSFEDDDSKGIKLLFAVDILNEGLHVKGIDGVVMLRNTASNIIFLQQLGRALAVDKSRKSAPVVFDLVNNVEVLEEDLKEFKNLVGRNYDQKDFGEVFTMLEDVLNIRGQISDLLKLAKAAATYTFDDRIAPLVAYAEEFGSIQRIKVGDTYIYRGKVFKIGMLKHTLRRDKEKLTEENIKKLEAIGMTWRENLNISDRVEILTAYVKEFGTLKQVGENVIYRYEDVDYNINKILISFRRAYRRNNLSEDEINRLNKIGMVWVAGGYGADNIRVELKYFVQDYLDFYKTYGRYPTKRGDQQGEFALYDRCLMWSDPKRRELTEEEKEYLIKNGIKVKVYDELGDHFKSFVEDFLNFYKINKRVPKQGEELYSRWFKWTNPDSLNEKQKEYLLSKGIEYRITSKNNISSQLLKFVSEYLEFCKTNGRKPKNGEKGSKGYIEGESSLYQRWRGWTNPNKQLTKEEKKYLEDNGIFTREITQKEIDGVRVSCIEFVKKWQAFIKKHNREPRETRSFKNSAEAVKGESALYAMYNEWTDPSMRRKKPTPKEIEYLNKHGIYIREAKQRVDNIRPELIATVEKYLEFVKKYGRQPYYKVGEDFVEGEKQLYSNMNEWKNPIRKNLNDDEIRYLQEKGFELSKPKVKKSSTGETFGV